LTDGGSAARARAPSAPAEIRPWLYHRLDTGPPSGGRGSTIAHVQPRELGRKDKGNKDIIKRISLIDIRQGSLMVRRRRVACGLWTVWRGTRGGGGGGGGERTSSACRHRGGHRPRNTINISD